MPIYEYLCRQCGSRFDFLVLSSTPPPTCSACGSDDLEKLMSAAAVSSGATQKRALKRAQKRVDKVRFDREWEAHKAAHDHDHDHD